MEFEGLRRSHSTPNLTPLIDIVFLLLVFFMLTAHFVDDESIAIDLPQAEDSAELNNDAALELAITPQGDILLQGERTALTELEAQLQRLLKNRDDKAIILRGDRNARLEQVVAILDISRRAGADAVAVMTQEP